MEPHSSSDAQGKDKRQWALIIIQEEKTFLNFHSQVYLHKTYRRGTPSQKPQTLEYQRRLHKTRYHASLSNQDKSPPSPQRGRSTKSSMAVNPPAT
ncbi:hypothetical protein QYF61_013629 [Mycteria americana]|uniref:Uncharacterized protein n=1 Tax=Mycteria americana TaxID=33587 RepID=A0AAN7Q304_MYCAM|nr:hypothetical protein QYF61_013629 [Mycteria americana]